ncbi:hypothetical protein [Photobacterium leiognathi]|uniref:DUF4145 domain-containing protein n=2 Tax=Photobacterium leiognathi TaxID=553611 RepID=A0A2T3M6V6_PHOLE|nr:hypothetical protein [Photobacterium leiognathi]KJF98757.1 hypothetical protein UB34_05880 [Photobacterium leiognathi]PSV87790.1 hypothetical protein CTM89_16265 [Photobacterium leiognathi]PSW57984.1 hypothetical protein C0W50_04315 [Photobacterium leiognathi subsp. mandapamensis]
MPRAKGINSFTDLYERAVGIRDNSFLSSFILGHLMTEYLLVKIAELKQPTLTKLIETLNHERLVELVFGLGELDEPMKETLLAINTMRNKLAHRISYTPSIIEYKNIVLLAQNSFSDMTDGFMQTLEEIEGKSSLDECDEFIFHEMFMQISYNLHELYIDLGGDWDIFHENT